MRILVILAAVAVAAAAPKKSTKIFPKKYDAAVHGAKDTYSSYQHAADEDAVVSAFSPFVALLPPLPSVLPEDSSYTGLGDAVGEDTLSPPPEDTYSSFSGTGHSALVPPQAFLAPKTPSSYLTFEDPSEEPLRPPPTSSYAQTPRDASGTEVLASLAAMIQALPHISSYTSYQRTTEPHTEDGGPARQMMPPSLPQSSYSSVPPSQSSPIPDPKLPVAMPSTDLVPPQ